MFAQNQLADFEAIWNREIAWFEPPNECRGGWSGVAKLILQGTEGKVLDLFIKKQENYGRRAKLPPFKVEPTFRREFNTLIKLEKLGFGAPKAVYYAEKLSKGQLQAILITCNLADYFPLDTLNSPASLEMTLLKKRTLIQCIATEIKRFHQLGFVHRALYAKHIFVKPVQQTFEIALIDFEKCRRTFFTVFMPIADLITLNYRTKDWTNTSRLHFFKSYFEVKKLNFFYRWLLVYIVKKSNKKQRHMSKI